jgi:diguanylate cyclase (GGDEF)-like protein
MSSQALVVVLAIVSTFVAGIAAASLWSAGRHVRRAERERRRAEDVQEAVALIGDALVATHDSKALLVVVLEATVTATGVDGGTASIGGAVVASTGTVAGPPALELQLADDPPASLALYTGDETLPDEMQHLAGSLAAQGRVALENVRLHRAAREQAVTDELTGLPNRRRFVGALSAELSRAARSDGRLSVLICDLDDFKRVNDEYGHVAGDIVLKHVANVIRSCLRDIDVPARLGGEEFAVVLPDATADGATIVAERIRAQLAESAIPIEGGGVTVTASFGVASCPPCEASDALLAEADKALYAAKRRGKNITVIAPVQEEAASSG